jgi:hypothetical protein
MVSISKLAEYFNVVDRIDWDKIKKYPASELFSVSEKDYKNILSRQDDESRNK